MKVLLIMNELKPSGAEVMIEKATPLWKEGGAEIVVVATGLQPGPYAPKLEAAGCRVIHEPLPARSTLSHYRAFGRLLKLERPDLIHLNAEAHAVPHTLVCRIACPNLVRTVHNNFPFEGLLRLRKRVARAVMRQLGCRFIAISPSVQGNERTRFSNPTRMIWNWADTETFCPPNREQKSAAREGLGIAPDEIVLLTVGNGSDVKNYAAVIRALASFPDRRIVYHQVGLLHPAGTDERLARELGVEERVRFQGPRSDVKDWMWAADVYLMPSVFEGFGLAAVEAMACGLPCVFADCPGLADFKEIAPEIIWVTPDSLGVEEGLERLGLGSHPGEIGLRDTASQKVREAFSTRRGAAEYLRFWEETIAAGK